MEPAWDVIAVVGSVFFIPVLVVASLVFAHYRRERLLMHEERMRALELGRELPEDAATARLKALTAGGIEDGKSPSLPRTCYSTALWVAFWGFLFAAQAGGSARGMAVALTIAASTGAIGVTAVICGTVLASRLRPARGAREVSKPFVENDAFDVVSSRG